MMSGDAVYSNVNLKAKKKSKLAFSDDDDSDDIDYTLINFTKSGNNQERASDNDSDDADYTLINFAKSGNYQGNANNNDSDDVDYTLINFAKSGNYQGKANASNSEAVTYSAVKVPQPGTSKHSVQRDDGSFSQSTAQNSEPLPTQHGHGIFMAQRDLAPMPMTPLREAKQRFYQRPQFLLFLCAIFFNLMIILGVLYSLEETAHVAALKSLEGLSINHKKVFAEKASLQKQLNESLGKLSGLNSSYISLTQEKTSIQNQLNGTKQDLQTERHKNRELSLDKERSETDLKNVTEALQVEKTQNKQLENEKSSQLKELNTLKNEKQTVEAERDQLKTLHSDTVKTLNDQRISNTFLSYIKDNIEEELKKFQANFHTASKDDQRKMLNTMLQALKAGCAIGWKNHTGQCYFFSSENLTWNQSRDACKTKGADLVIIETSKEGEFLKGQVSEKTHYWIGLTDSEKESMWRWVNNKVLETSESHWLPEEPDNWKGTEGRLEGEDCAKTNGREGRWLDGFCDEQIQYICETKAAVKSYN